VGVWPRVMKRENRTRREERELSGVGVGGAVMTTVGVGVAQ
jgi:hypothetical protein